MSDCKGDGCGFDELFSFSRFGIRQGVALRSATQQAKLGFKTGYPLLSVLLNTGYSVKNANEMSSNDNKILQWLL